MTCYWEVKIDIFTGVRLEIGVATRRSIYRGGFDKAEVCLRCAWEEIGGLRANDTARIKLTVCGFGVLSFFQSVLTIFRSR